MRWPIEIFFSSVYIYTLYGVAKMQLYPLYDSSKIWFCLKPLLPFFINGSRNSKSGSFNPFRLVLLTVTISHILYLSLPFNSLINLYQMFRNALSLEFLLYVFLIDIIWSTIFFKWYANVPNLYWYEQTLEWLFKEMNFNRNSKV